MSQAFALKRAMASVACKLGAGAATSVAVQGHGREDRGAGFASGRVQGLHRGSWLPEVRWAAVWPHVAARSHRSQKVLASKACGLTEANALTRRSGQHGWGIACQKRLHGCAMALILTL